MGTGCSECSCIGRQEENEMIKDLSNSIANDVSKDNTIRIRDDDVEICKSNNAKAKANCSTNSISMTNININLTITNRNNINEIKPNYSEAQTDIELIQAAYRSYLLRKRYKAHMKSALQVIELSLIEKTLLSYRHCIVREAEANCLSTFFANNWKQFYEDNPNLALTKGDDNRILKTNLLITQDSIDYCYIGQVNIFNKRHGLGLLLINQGDQYEGNWNCNVFEGWGRLIDTEGNIYEGLFINNALTGKGTKTTLNNWKYSGDFKKFLREGKGIEETDDHIYEGHFIEDKKNGLGKVRYQQTQDVYEGEFKDNEITGQGTFSWGTGHTYTGTFLNGKMHGYGKYKWAKGGEYEGEYINGIKQGKGTFKWADGRIFKGPFENGKPNGFGKLIISGVEYDVEFTNGKLKQSLQEIENNKLKISSLSAIT